MSNIVRFPGSSEEPISIDLACPEEGCGNTFFILKYNEENKTVTPTCARCEHELEEYPYEEEQE